MTHPTSPRTRGRLLLTMAASGLLTLATAACSTLPHSDSPQQAERPTSGASGSAGLGPSATPDADPRGILVEVFADYDVRNNRAIAAADRLDPSLWATADVEGVLAGDLFDTRLDAERRKASPTPTDARVPGVQLAHVAVRQLGATQQRHPRWVMGLFQRHRVAPAPTASASATASATTSPTAADIGYAVLVQAAPDTPWLLAQLGPTWSADIPAGELTQLSEEADRRAATSAAMVVRDWLSTGGGPIDFGRVDQLRQEIIHPDRDYGIGRLSCTLYTLTPDATGMSEVVRAVRSADRWLVSAAYRCERTIIAGDFGTVWWDTGYDRIYGGGKGRYLTQPVVVHVLFQTAPGGSTIRLLGGRWDSLLP